VSESCCVDVAWADAKKQERKQKQKLETTEMKFLTNVAGYKLKDQIRNTVIRNELIFNLSNIVPNNRLNWIQDVERMEPGRTPKQIMDYTPRGTRSIGLPTLPWKDQPVL
jgi:hypothetical protein